MNAILAHAGHWTTSLIYLAPVLLIVLALLWQRIRDRRAGRAPDQHDEPILDDILDGKKQQ